MDHFRDSPLCLSPGQHTITFGFGASPTADTAPSLPVTGGGGNLVLAGLLLVAVACVLGRPPVSLTWTASGGC